MTQDDADLVAKVQDLIADDPDDSTRETLQALLAAGDLHALRSLFGTPLTFGTAGLRGLLGPGPGCMNLYVIERTTAGLCLYLRAAVEHAEERGLCIGYDARHRSHEFAHAAAAIALGLGFRVALFSEAGPTPLLAFAVNERRAAAGVMVTASHNPPAYNGYKVYNQHGAQIVEPEDKHISACIEGIASVRALPRTYLTQAGERLSELGPGLESQYLKTIAKQLPGPSPSAPLRIAYSALHGVGGRICLDALREAGFSDLHDVQYQQEPDPEFPTTPFPNPEEPGTLDGLRALANEVNADIALANDPDADRLAVVVRDEAGALVTLTGNEVGVLLCDYLLRLDQDASDLRGRPMVAYSLVSTPMVERIAQAYGAYALQTLTGFKWICNEALAMEARGYRFVFGFEEALGYAIGHAVRDKDGIAAAVAVTQLAASEKARGRTLWQALDNLSRRDGCYVSGQVAHSFKGPSDADLANHAVAKLRNTPPTMLGRFSVIAFTDLQHGLRMDAGGTRTPATLPRSNVLVLQLADSARVCIRPSGTEPKLKLYFDACVAMGATESFSQARARASQYLNELQVATLGLLGLTAAD